MSQTTGSAHENARQQSKQNIFPQTANTRGTDFSEKVPDYRDTESIVQIVLVEPDERKVYSWINANGGWRQYEINEGKLLLPSLGLTLSFDEIYEDA